VSREASAEALTWVWPAASAAHLFDTYGDLEAFWAAGKWRVRVTDAGEAAIVDRWRERLALLAVRGLWCASARIPFILEDLRTLAEERGFERLLGPMVSETDVGPYLAAGMEVGETLLVLRLEHPGRLLGRREPSGPVRLRAATLDDLASVARVDRASFDEFWAYDTPALGAYLSKERAVVAEENAEVIGYTLATLKGHEGTVGRIAVHPGHRGHGIGTALLSEAVTHLVSQGAERVTLCTQEGNAVSRRLYTGAGFRIVGGRLVSTVSAQLG
jgi:[ribosomal protein S18]-alanine N-acetyltransferase